MRRRRVSGCEPAKHDAWGQWNTSPRSSLDDEDVPEAVKQAVSSVVPPGRRVGGVSPPGQPSPRPRLPLWCTCTPGAASVVKHACGTAWATHTLSLSGFLPSRKRPSPCLFMESLSARVAPLTVRA